VRPAEMADGTPAYQLARLADAKQAISRHVIRRSKARPRSA
jgi:hypothetical protein